MSTLEKVWANVRRATILTVELAASFGLAEQTLRADSALLPIAHYIFKREPPENWLAIVPSPLSERRAVGGQFGRCSSRHLYDAPAQ